MSTEYIIFVIKKNYNDDNDDEDNEYEPNLTGMVRVSEDMVAAIVKLLSNDSTIVKVFKYEYDEEYSYYKNDINKFFRIYADNCKDTNHTITIKCDECDTNLNKRYVKFDSNDEEFTMCTKCFDNYEPACGCGCDDIYNITFYPN